MPQSAAHSLKPCVMYFTKCPAICLAVHFGLVFSSHSTWNYELKNLEI